MWKEYLVSRIGRINSDSILPFTAVSFNCTRAREILLVFFGFLLFLFCALLSPITYRVNTFNLMQNHISLALRRCIRLLFHVESVHPVYESQSYRNIVHKEFLRFHNKIKWRCNVFGMRLLLCNQPLKEKSICIVVYVVHTIRVYYILATHYIHTHPYINICVNVCYTVVICESSIQAKYIIFCSWKILKQIRIKLNYNNRFKYNSEY